jgi:PKD repeat protein
VDFSETVDPVEAGNAGNDTIAGLTVSAAQVVNADRSVRLTTGAMTPDASYTLVVNNVQDVAGNTILPNSSINFDFFDIMIQAFQDGLEPGTGYEGTTDAYIREASATASHGLETTLQVDGSEPSGSVTDMNIVLGWDIGSIPTDAIVQDASISLQVSNASNGSYQCHALLTAWTQSQVTWNEASTGVSWGAPGASSAADRGSDVLCTVSASATGPLNVSFTPAGLALVQSWVNNPGSNYGMVIADPNTSDGADFHSSESSTAMSRPKLSVTYRVPVTPTNEDPVAGLSYSCTELDCSFTDTSSDNDGSVVAWDWDFGDGNSSTEQNPAHSYAAEGDYTVSLTVTDDDGATASVNMLVSVDALINPAASFSFSCSDLDCSFTDTSADNDGSVVAWDWDFGDSNSSAVQNPAHSYSAAGDYTVSLTVTDTDGLTGSANALVSVNEPQPWIDQFAEADLGGSGSVSGTFSDTHADDDAVQAVTETESGGKKQNRHSFLEKTWQFTVAPGSMVSLHANAWSGGSLDNDEFVFAWSTDNSNFNDLFTVASTDDSIVQSGTIPASGTVYIRVRDTDRTTGNRTRDTVFVDHLYIRSENGEIPDQPTAPSGLSAAAAGSTAIDLSWSHPETDEAGFDLERAPAGSGSWTQVASPAGGSSAYTNTGLSAATGYDYRLRARNAGGTSAWSNIASATTDAPPPISLIANGTTKRGKHEVKLNWTNASSANVAVVRDAVIIASPPNNGKYTDRTGNTGSRTYVYQVCETGTSSCSNEVTVVY